VVLLIKEFRIN